MVAFCFWLAVQDVMQVLIVVACVYSGWCSWSALLRALAPPCLGAEPAGKSLKLASKPAPEPKREPGPEDRGVAILEHYGVLGARPGAWRSRPSRPWPDALPRLAR
mmetsp:Transcript_15011/g.43818  ORF Transcript_15011/g.43818 Transcript_15011/m.43818 type:complete len:106 (+) Transcript_15011:127-444(+)